MILVCYTDVFSVVTRCVTTRKTAVKQTSMIQSKKNVLHHPLNLPNSFKLDSTNKGTSNIL